MQACSVRATALSTLAPTRPVSRAFTPVVAKAAESRKASTQARHKRLRKKLDGTSERPRMAVFKSNEHIYVQVIDDSVGHTLVSASSVTKDMKGALESGANVAAAEAVGKKVAELCLAKNIDKVCFDRGGFKYHGRIQAVADGARAGGLSF
ncbi:plastid/chloroplast ribosomal protein L18 [Volvox carteri f. nagariensis]|uniref:Large ribosomal subunit protein uL18c n=1 Tax=Volvox carteri f. nagariensis TaxID=3068 RepID=D8TQ12_VOLCA|nr:plastid/chloroplast ribosomal protein L18 [Volvox carteri f. nagariensis]EFJ50322.1 plastid/chloroplast ribosomal protein L18 [Volvox carteri f. nagariensis]|eukprot:XP_002948447.1 plastid/chloroplast ribosomal protein L18 [Volvox carteri f. nagariensis]